MIPFLYRYRMPIEKRFWLHVNKKGPKTAKLGRCWQWTSGQLKGGYGSFSIKSRSTGAHRVAWMITTGENPKGKQVCHRCDNRLCVNAKHLFVGTQKDNVDDMIVKGRSGCIGKLGVDNTKAKLTEQSVLEIRKLHGQGKLNLYRLADMFKVSRANIGYIVRRKVWKHI